MNNTINKHHWRGLDTDHQAARYQAIAAMCHGTVLDVGCGSGILAGYVPQWTGIELQAEAVGEIAQNRAVHVCSAEAFQPEHQEWDTVVFNESLYYCDNPLRMLKKYRGMLAEQGTLIVSIYQKPVLGWRQLITRSNKDVGDLVDFWAMEQAADISRKDIPQAGTYPWRIWSMNFHQ